MARYTSRYTGAQIDSLLGKADNSLQFPTLFTQGFRFVAISGNAQAEADLGNGLVYENNSIKVSDAVSGIVIYAEDTEQSGGWDCPALTVEQVTTAYNVLAAGKSLTIVSEDESVQFRAVLGDSTTGNPCILVQYYWLGWIDYQVTANDTVAITVHKVPEAPAHQITSVVVGTDTIDITIT